MREFVSGLNQVRTRRKLKEFQFWSNCIQISVGMNLFVSYNDSEMAEE